LSFEVVSDKGNEGMEQNDNAKNTLVEGRGGPIPATSTGAKTLKVATKIVNQKKRRLTKREAEEWNALAKQKGPTPYEPDGREAAFEDLGDEELCCDLAGKFARESARKTGDVIADIRDRYDAIALGFRCARGAQSGEFPLALGSALNALAEEFQRDRKGLQRFLDAVFERWQKIDQPDSLWRVRLITQQHLGKPEVVAQYVENVGAASCTTAQHTESLRAKIRQYRSRERRNALRRRKSV
jgi:hypothetical protein